MVTEISRRQVTSDFNLLDMAHIYEQSGGRTDDPHRHDYYTVLFVISAIGLHHVDFRAVPFGQHEVHFVSPGQVHQVETYAKPEGRAITFSRDFLVENNIPERFITNINLFRPFGEAPPLSLDEETFHRLLRIVGEMETCMPRDLAYRSRALGALLQLFLIFCNNNTSITPQHLDEEDAAICILRDFKNLVEEKFATFHKVKDYAAAIHLSPKHLSQTVRELTGKTAKNIIQDRLILESKRLLRHTDLAVKEIAYRIGFEEPLHFSGFFKKQTGVAPTEYRKAKPR